MATKKIIKRFPDGTWLEYDRGRFDNWCVYFCNGSGRRAILDIEYFSQLKNMASKYGKRKVYKAFEKIYDETEWIFNPDILKKIDTISNEFGTDALLMNILLTELYATMIAEENKRGSVLGKKIKRFGIHQVLFQGFTVEQAASYTKGMKAKDIERMCVAAGF